ncbi:MAG TPA: serine/threonine-protein kinase [Holophagaceae bacterium]|nr:serine/threonine-protein kinase [Holophagaceae bacterium]
MFNRLGKYELLGSLGQGAMGEVFLAKDPVIGRTLAVKTILASSTAGEGARERFAREARAAGTLNHPGIVTIHEFGEDQGVLYLAMEYVEGDDLQALLAERALSKAELLEVLAQVAEALAYAHRKGVLHRDVKPANIRVSRESGRLQAKLMDFGIARLSESTMTSAGILMGTVAYMAPEYVRTGQADGRSDLFAVGVMLYEGLAGQLPFAGDTTATILYRLVHEPPAPLPAAALAGASPALRGVLARLLEKDPDRRYADGDAVAAALRSAKDPAWPGDGTPTVATRRPEAAPPRRAAAPWLAAAAVLLALGGGAVLWRHRQTRPVVLPAPPIQAQVPASGPAPRTETDPKPAPEAPAEKPAPTTAPTPAPKPESKPESRPVPKSVPVPPKPQPAPQPASDPPPVDLMTATREVDADPAKAHRDLARLIAQEPTNPHLRALDLVALAKAGDGAGFVTAWDAAQAAGIAPQALRFTPRFAFFLQEQKRNPTLPEEALERLKAAYAGQEKPRRWRRR